MWDNYIHCVRNESVCLVPIRMRKMDGRKPKNLLVTPAALQGCQYKEETVFIAAHWPSYLSALVPLREGNFFNQLFSYVDRA